MPVPLVVTELNEPHKLPLWPVMHVLSEPKTEQLATVWKHDFFDAQQYETVSFDHFATPYHHYMESILG